MEENKTAPDFYGNRVLGLKKDVDTAWWKAYKALVIAFYEFIVGNEIDVLAWGGENDVETEFGKHNGQAWATKTGQATPTPTATAGATKAPAAKA